VSTRTVTLALPETLVRDAAELAAHRHTTLSALISAALRDVIARERGYGAAWERTSARMQRGYDLGVDSRGAISRDELHERR
jgi:predicted transcriptional regulator